MEIAYAVKASYVEQGYEGGDVAIGEDGTYHLGEELAKGAGYVIVEADSLASIRLDEQMALERVSLETARKAQSTPPKREPKADKAEAKSTTDDKEG